METGIGSQWAGIGSQWTGIGSQKWAGIGSLQLSNDRMALFEVKWI